MTIKLYSISIGYGEVPGDVEASTEESLRGDYLKVADLKERLEYMLDLCLYGPEGLPSQIRTLLEELQ